MKLKQMIFMKIFMRIKIRLIISDYPRDSKFFYPFNKKVIGKIKGKFKGKIISEFFLVKSKMYFLIALDGEEIKKAKEVNKNVVKNTRHKEHVDVWFNKKLIRYKIKRI